LKKIFLITIENLYSAPTQQDAFRIRYRLLQKVDILGNFADGIIECQEDRSICFTFYSI